MIIKLDIHVSLTPKQGKSVNSELAKIYDIPKSIDLDYDVSWLTI